MEEKDKQTAPGADETKNPPPGTEEDKQTAPGADETKNPPPGTEEDKPADGGEISFKAAIDEVKAAYEERIAKLNEDHKKELDERTEVIKQLLTGNKSVDEATESMQTVSEQINKKRKYEF